MLDKQAHRVVVAKLATHLLDYAIRASVLERVAGIPRNQWSDNLSRFLREAPIKLPMLDPIWYAKGTVCYDALYAGALGVLHNPTQAEDVIQEFFVGNWAAGLVRDMDNNLTGRSSLHTLKHLLGRRGFQWGTDEIKSSKYTTQNKPVNVKLTEPDIEYSDMEQFQGLLALTADDINFASYVTRHLSSVLRKSALDVWKMKLMYPQANYNDLADMLGYPNMFKEGIDTGYPDPSPVRVHIKTIYETLVHLFRTDTKLQNAVHLYLQAHGPIHKFGSRKY